MPAAGCVFAVPHFFGHVLRLDCAAGSWEMLGPKPPARPKKYDPFAVDDSEDEAEDEAAEDEAAEAEAVAEAET